VIATLNIIGGLLNLISGIGSFFGEEFFLIKVYSSSAIFQWLQDYTRFYGVLSIFILITVAWIITDVLLLCGISRNKNVLLIPWLAVKMIALMVSQVFQVYVK